MKLPFFALFKIIMEGKSSIRFLIGAVGSFAFSIAVILCTVGLMDGFESTLVKSLQKASGDLIITNIDGFFRGHDSLKNIQKSPLVKSISTLSQVEAFFISQGNSKGVLVKGIEPQSFGKVTGLNIEIQNNEIGIGKALQETFGLKPGDDIVLTFASSSKSSQGSPILKNFQVKSIVEHGVFEKDMRYIYVHQETLLDVLNYIDDSVNMAILKTVNYKNLDQLKEIAFDLQSKVDKGFRVQTFWDDFKVILEAVEVEKFSITLVLQLIVVVSIFNIIAFIIFISEKKSQEFFLLRALGLGINTLTKFWYILLLFIWGISSLLSILLTYIFNYLLVTLPFFKLPGDIYVLSRLHIDLTLSDFVIVFGLALIWILVIGFLSLLKIRGKSLVQGLRQEFT